MDYQKLYREKLTTAEEAVKVVKSGDWVDYGWCTNTARSLDKALAARYLPQTTSRISGEYDTLLFMGEDIRAIRRSQRYN